MTDSLEAGEPRQVGPYRLVRRLGRGVLGEVFLGRSQGGRLVAVRLVAAELAGDTEFRCRFAEQVAAARKVGAFHAAQIVDADPEGSPPWLATAYIPGPSLAEAVGTHGPLPYEAVRVLGCGLAEGLAAIHSAGLVHGGLTPGNVILADDGPRITDFAIPRALDSAGASGGFRSPEQVRRGDIGPACDLFSLAAVLVFAATGRGPFDGAPGPVGEDRIVNGKPDLSGLPGPLTGLLADCLAKDPDARPGLPDVLSRLAGSGRSPAPWLAPPAAGTVNERRTEGGARGGLRRPGRRALLAVAGVGALAAVGVPVGAVLASRGGGDSDTDAEGGGLGGGGKGVAAAEKLVPAAVLDLGRVDNVVSLAYSPDGTLLAVTGEKAVALWDTASRSRVATLPVNDALGVVHAVSFSRNGLLAVGYHRVPDLTSGDYATDIGGVTVWDASRRELATVVSASEDKQLQGIQAVALSPDGEVVAGGRNGRDCIGKVPLWDVSSGMVIDTLVVGAGKGSRTSAVRSVAFSPDGRMLAAGYGEELTGGVALWETSSYELVATMPMESTDAFGVTSLAFGADGNTLAGSFGGIALWDTSSHQRIATFGDADSGYQSVAFTSDGSMVAGGHGGRAGGGGVTLWDVSSREEVVSVAVGRSGAGDLAFSPDDRTLAAATASARLRTVIHLWTVE